MRGTAGLFGSHGGEKKTESKLRNKGTKILFNLIKKLMRIHCGQEDLQVSSKTIIKKPHRGSAKRYKVLWERATSLFIVSSEETKALR